MYDSKMHFELSKGVGFLSEACVDVNNGSEIDPSIEHKFRVKVTNHRQVKLFNIHLWTTKMSTIYYGNDYDWYVYQSGKLKQVLDTLSIFAFREMTEEWKALNP